MRDQYPKRLIEVGLPIKRISNHARREKSVGPLSILHIWWARRPLAACRAVICAVLWPDPSDSLCPATFREKARKLMLEWTAHERQVLLSPESRPRFEAARQNPKEFANNEELRKALLDFIADFASLDNSMVGEFLETSRALTQTAHVALGGAPGTRPLVVDPFAGGGSIPIEALRVGTDAFASDLNPVSVLLNKVMIEYIPKYGKRLAEAVQKWGDWIGKEAKKELAPFYPQDQDGATPIAYLWAKTIRCEGPSCGAEIPIFRSPWLSKAPNSQAYLAILSEEQKLRHHVRLEVRYGKTTLAGSQGGTVRRGGVTCPCCGFTLQRSRVETIAKAGELGETMLAVVTSRSGRRGRQYRTPAVQDHSAFENASRALSKLPISPFRAPSNDTTRTATLP